MVLRRQRCTRARSSICTGRDSSHSPNHSRRDDPTRSARPKEADSPRVETHQITWLWRLLETHASMPQSYTPLSALAVHRHTFTLQPAFSSARQHPALALCYAISVGVALPPLLPDADAFLLAVRPSAPTHTFSSKPAPICTTAVGRGTREPLEPLARSAPTLFARISALLAAVFDDLVGLLCCGPPPKRPETRGGRPRDAALPSDPAISLAAAVPRTLPALTDLIKPTPFLFSSSASRCSSANAVGDRLLSPTEALAAA